MLTFGVMATLDEMRRKGLPKVGTFSRLSGSRNSTVLFAFISNAPIRPYRLRDLQHFRDKTRIVIFPSFFHSFLMEFDGIWGFRGWQIQWCYSFFPYPDNQGRKSGSRRENTISYFLLVFSCNMGFSGSANSVVIFIFTVP